MGNTTALYAKHLAAGAKIVDFAGWDMPLHYGSQLQEHHQVRRDAGMFDVSHMTVTDFHGPQAQAFLQYLLANDVARLRDGKALYTCMLNENGGVIDDLIVYREAEDRYRLVVNAATRDKDLAWINRQAADYQTEIRERTDLAMLAVQGPQARALTLPLLPLELQESAAKLKPFYACRAGEWFVGRTGYTGEDGFEIMLPTEASGDFWDHLLAAGVKPVGLGARDTLRLEAGMCLYGSDMDEQTTPYEAGLAWTVAWEPEARDFIGRAALAPQQAAGADKTLKGLVLSGKGVLRAHQTVYAGDTVIGEITSGTFSPTLGVSVALARIDTKQEGEVSVDIRGKKITAKIVKPPFVRHGKSMI